jgi:FtsZ-binding cell division protein ZapB
MAYQYGASQKIPVNVALRLKERDDFAHENARLLEEQARLQEQVKELEASNEALQQQVDGHKFTINSLESRIWALLLDSRATHRQTTVKCGTNSGYVRHLRQQEQPCPACKTARAMYQRDYRRRKAAA